ncbi:MAG: NRDE family protein [Acidobacteria bacterium]|nr:NRDE family protein [Acidobacteriota bacterium]
MCTVTWLVEEDGYSLFFNRDERHSRGIAFPPSVDLRNGVEYLSPTDADGGGTWITANQFGLTICLLNSYQQGPQRDVAFETRGRIPIEFADARSIAEVADGLETFSLRRFAPFRLLVLQPGEQPWTCLWNGSVLSGDTDARPTMPLTSSSFQTEQVEAARQDTFRQQFCLRGPTKADLEAFHRGHNGESGAHSVCMHRHDAQTVSYSRVTVDEESVCFAYAPGSPCNGEGVNIIRLSRLRARRLRWAAAG